MYEKTLFHFVKNIKVFQFLRVRATFQKQVVLLDENRCEQRLTERTQLCRYSFFVGSLYRTDNLTHFKDADDEEQEHSCKSLTPPLKV